MLDRNGNDALAHRDARVDELAAAVDHITRELAETWRPRLLALERDVERLTQMLARAEPDE